MTTAPWWENKKWWKGGDYDFLTKSWRYNEDKIFEGINFKNEIYCTKILIIEEKFWAEKTSSLQGKQFLE